ncbi:hypothetical protein QOZ91_002351 [Clostridium sardiniense]|nr:hypothetical protein [Clostridium sardiniense]
MLSLFIYSNKMLKALRYLFQSKVSMSMYGLKKENGKILFLIVRN